jgi:hypothetical protein
LQNGGGKSHQADPWAIIIIHPSSIYWQMKISCSSIDEIHEDFASWILLVYPIFIWSQCLKIINLGNGFGNQFSFSLWWCIHTWI